jgi:aromatic-amino-acid transaminase
MTDYNRLPEAPLDPIMQAGAQWRQMLKTYPDPVNTTVGVLLDPLSNGNIWRPDTVVHALTESEQWTRTSKNYDYQPQAGNKAYLDGMAKLVLNQELGPHVIAAQALGGTGALTLAKKTFEALVPASKDSGKIPLIFDDGWPNHRNIFGDSFAFGTYPRTDIEQNHHALMELIGSAEPNTAVLLQACGYNDDGIDRTKQQWDEVLDAIESKDLPLLIDAAYLGLANGLEDDRYAIRGAIDRGILTLVAASASKNMGLYNERVGALFIANADTRIGDSQQARLKQAVDKAVRGIYSSPSLYGAQAVGNMLARPIVRERYMYELSAARMELNNTREELADILGNEFAFVRNGRGLFTKLVPTGFTQQQQDYLQQAGILTLPNSRLNIGGIAPHKVERVGTEILRALKLTA